MSQVHLTSGHALYSKINLNSLASLDQIESWRAAFLRPHRAVRAEPRQLEQCLCCDRASVPGLVFGCSESLVLCAVDVLELCAVGVSSAELSHSDASALQVGMVS